MVLLSALTRKRCMEVEKAVFKQTNKKGTEKKCALLKTFSPFKAHIYLFTLKYRANIAFNFIHNLSNLQVCCRWRRVGSCTEYPR